MEGGTHYETSDKEEIAALEASPEVAEVEQRKKKDGAK